MYVMSMFFTVVPSVFFVLHVDTSGGMRYRPRKKQHFIKQYEKNRQTLEKHQNYLFKCPTCFRLSDVLIVSWQMVDRPNTLLQLQDCFLHRISIL